MVCLARGLFPLFHTFRPVTATEVPAVAKNRSPKKCRGDLLFVLFYYSICDFAVLIARSLSLVNIHHCFFVVCGPASFSRPRQ